MEKISVVGRLALDQVEVVGLEKRLYFGFYIINCLSRFAVPPAKVPKRYHSAMFQAANFDS